MTLVAEPESFGERLKRLRRDSFWTQEQMAAQIGATQRSVCNWEMDSQRPSLRMLPRLAEALGVTVQYLQTGLFEE